jgi:cell shape-determining protein MreC
MSPTPSVVPSVVYFLLHTFISFIQFQLIFLLISKNLKLRRRLKKLNKYKRNIQNVIKQLNEELRQNLRSS